MRRYLLSMTLVPGCLFVAAEARAGDVHPYPECIKQPSESEIQGAKGAFQAGMASYGEADYERAILYWEDAYRRDCTATLLLHHLARAFEGQGNLQQAIVALRAYLDRTPDGVDRPQIQKRIEVFEQKIEEEEKRKAAEEEQKRQALLAQSKPAPAPVAQAAKPSSLYVSPIIPLAVASVGLVSTVVGTVIYFPAKSDLAASEDACPSRRNCDPSIESAGNTARSKVNWGGTMAISGLVLAAGGVGWYFFNESRAPKHQAHLQAPPRDASRNPRTAALLPWVGVSQAGLLVHGSF